MQFMMDYFAQRRLLNLAQGSLVNPIASRDEIVQPVGPCAPKRPACHVLVEQDSAIGDVFNGIHQHSGLVLRLNMMYHVNE